MTQRAPLPDQSERRHSAVCIDYRECDGGTECICIPPADTQPPATYELWWCSYCGEPSSEDSDPCQRCGEPIVRRTYVAVDEQSARSENESGSWQRSPFGGVETGYDKP